MGSTVEQRSGSWAEQRALRLLLGRGWHPLARQWRCRWGEIDLLVEKPGRLLLVEVKGRRRCGLDGWGVAALDRRKRQRLEAAYGLWLVEHPAYERCSLELVCALVPLPPIRGQVRWVRWG
ncbi:MAG: YraN family protein [Vulcanococcus sp.]